jgi:hypothetical protein
VRDYPAVERGGGFALDRMASFREPGSVIVLAGVDPARRPPTGTTEIVDPPKTAAAKEFCDNPVALLFCVPAAFALYGVLVVGSLVTAPVRLVCKSATGDDFCAPGEPPKPAPARAAPAQPPASPRDEREERTAAWIRQALLAGATTEALDDAHQAAFEAELGLSKAANATADARVKLVRLSLSRIALVEAGESDRSLYLCSRADVRTHHAWRAYETCQREPVKPGALAFRDGDAPALRALLLDAARSLAGAQAKALAGEAPVGNLRVR